MVANRVDEETAIFMFEHYPCFQQYYEYLIFIEDMFFAPHGEYHNFNQICQIQLPFQRDWYYIDGSLKCTCCIFDPEQRSYELL